MNLSLELFCCPSRRGHSQGGPCQGELSQNFFTELVTELSCKKCKSKFPVLAGIPVLVDRPEQYILEHAKGIERVLSQDELMKCIPKKLQSRFFAECRAAKNQQAEHIEEDLEAERVNSLYLATHYLTALDFVGKGGTRQIPPELAEVVRKYWDAGPATQVAKLLTGGGRVLDLGCGVGGMFQRWLQLSFAHKSYEKATQLQNVPFADQYIGIDSSFSSLAIASQLYASFRKGKSFQIKIPDDLIGGPLTSTVEVSPLKGVNYQKCKPVFAVCDLENLPILRGVVDECLSLNTIDMCVEPEKLINAMASTLKKGGRAVLASPYVWHPVTARRLRKKYASSFDKGSSEALVREICVKSGFKIDSEQESVPWVFFKHRRQIEVYSVHILSLLN